MTDKSVGLIVLTEIPLMGLVAVLRERGWFNPETMKPESWPGACQVTAHGRLKPGEDFRPAIFREMAEELGQDFADYVLDWIAVFPNSFEELWRFENDNKEVVAFALKVDCTFLEKIRLGPESGSMRLVTLSEAANIVDLALFDKAVGVRDRRTIAMFADEKEAVKKAFEFAINE